MRNVVDGVVEKVKAHILFSVTFCCKHAVLCDTWKNVVQPDRPHEEYNAALSLRMLDN
jgi:hypothetical protein